MSVSLSHATFFVLVARYFMKDSRDSVCVLVGGALLVVVVLF